MEARRRPATAPASRTLRAIRTANPSCWVSPRNRRGQEKPRLECQEQHQESAARCHSRGRYKGHDEPPAGVATTAAQSRIAVDECGRRQTSYAPIADDQQDDESVHRDDIQGPSLKQEQNKNDARRDRD